MTDRFDLKLFLLRFIRKIYVPAVGAVIGALIVGGIYLFVQLVVKPAQYRERVVIHQELHYDDWNGQYTYINGYTWNQILGMDWVTEKVSENLSNSVPADEIRNYISSDLLSDTRVIYFYVTTGSVEKTKEVFGAFIPVLKTLPDSLGEIDDLTILDTSKEPERVNNTENFVRAVILGAVLGLCIAAFILSILIIVDDSVYIPQLFEEKYGIDCEYFDAALPEGVSVISKSIPDISECLDGNNALYIEAAANNGKIVDYVLHELKKKNITVSRAYITKPVNWIIKGYYAAKKFPNPFVK